MAMWAWVVIIVVAVLVVGAAAWLQLAANGARST